MARKISVSPRIAFCASGLAWFLSSTLPSLAQTPDATAAKPSDEANKPAEQTNGSSKTILGAEYQPMPLSECLRIAYERQPALAAARSSLAAREAAHAGVSNLNLPFQRLLAPDLCIRRQQSLQGITAGQAEVVQAEFDTAYSVIRLYYTAVFAQEQYAVADKVFTSLENKRKTADQLAESGAFSIDTINRLKAYTLLASNKRTEARTGYHRAIAALREAMGVGNDCAGFRPLETSLPEVSANPCKAELIALALARRGEIVQAIVAADVSRLEVDAQGRFSFRPLVRTFASSSDIHSKVLPAAVRGSGLLDYKPGAISPEFPANLAGQKPYRMAQASAYADRMGAVVEKTRGLVTLEVEDAILAWQDAEAKGKAAKDAVAAAEAAEKSSTENFSASAVLDPEKKPRGDPIRKEDAIQDSVLAGQARAAANEARLEKILAVASLERITAGGFCSNLVVAPPAIVSPAPATPTATPTTLPEPGNNPVPQVPTTPVAK